VVRAAVVTFTGRSDTTLNFYQRLPPAPRSGSQTNGIGVTKEAQTPG
jgi:hypothetical protein